MSNPKIILLSPHCDDIAFSISGTVKLFFSKKVDILLVNIFNLSSYHLSSYKTAKSTSRVRYVEDKKFATKLSLKKIDLNFPDSSILKHTDHSELICAPTDSRLPSLKLKLYDLFSKINAYKIFCPLGIGGHIDHKMVKEICLEFYQNNYKHLIFYEDLPYATSSNLDEIDSFIKKSTNIILHPQYINITKVWSLKEEAICIYKSQVSKAILTRIKKYAQRISINKNELYERIWVSEEIMNI